MGGYPGSFPNGFLNRVDAQYGLYDEDCLFPFGGAMPKDVGASGDWVVNDINPDLGHTTHDATDLPDSWGGEYSRVLADPPYGEGWADKLYDLEHPGYKNLWSEAARCVEEGGYLFVLDYLVYINYSQSDRYDYPYTFERLQPVAVTTGPNTRIRVLNVFRRVD